MTNTGKAKAATLRLPCAFFSAQDTVKAAYQLITIRDAKVAKPFGPSWSKVKALVPSREVTQGEKT